jgi:hypothetical protein
MISWNIGHFLQLSTNNKEARFIFSSKSFDQRILRKSLRCD